jgi:hypothetical protein
MPHLKAYLEYGHNENHTEPFSPFVSQLNVM